MNPVGKPDAVNPHVRFDERGRETEPLAKASTRAAAGRRLILLTTQGEINLWEFRFAVGDILLVGRESAGAPHEVHERADARVAIPIRPPLRSLNVGVAAAIAMSAALRQLGRLPGGGPRA